ncbi:MAG: TolC family outer membrane protein [Syntrophaceae bacterium]|nr:TolC family outer membrane protein [Syntrophaceae bacterium]
MKNGMIFRCIRRRGTVRLGPGGAGALVILALIVCSTTAFAEDLLGVYGLALKNDPRFVGARYERDASAEKLSQARAGLLPKLTAEGVYTQTRQNIISSDNTVYGQGSSTFPTTEYSITLVQPLFNMASWASLKRARATVKGADLKLETAKQDLMVRLARSYLSALATRDNLEFISVEEAAVSRYHDLVTGRFSSGLTSRTDFLDAKARLSDVKARKIAAQSNQDDAFQSLREIVGQDIVKLAPIREDLPLVHPDPNNIDTWIDATVKQNPSLEMQRQAVEEAQHEIRRQQAGHYPFLNLEAEYDRTKTEGTLFGGGSEVETAYALVRLSVPIFEGGIVNSRTREARSLHQAAVQEEERQTRAARKETRAAYLGVVSAIDRVKALREAVEAQQMVLEAKREGYRSGLYTVLAVLDAERDLYRARRDYAVARYDYIMNSLRLKKAVGTLNDGDIASINDWFVKER